MKDSTFSELASLFFSTKQIMKKQMPRAGQADPNAWLHFETMRFIGETKDPSMHDVANFLRIKAPSATSLVAHLADAGLVARKSALGDKRVVRIALTARGRREVANYTKRAVATMRKTFSKLDAREITTLSEILRHLRDAHAR